MAQPPLIWGGLTVIGLSFFDMYKFRGGRCCFASLFSGCITTKFCTGVSYNHSVTSNIKKDFQKSDDIVDNDIIMLKALWLSRK